MSRELTAGEECQAAARTFDAFAGRQGAVPAQFVSSAFGIAIVRGTAGVAVVRLKTGDWSAPCAIALENPNGAVQPGQETVLLFMTSQAIFKLVTRALLVLNSTHKFVAGPIHGGGIVDDSVDVYGWVRYNQGFTQPDVVNQAMTGWVVREDPARHGRWHGAEVTWYDVLTNKITVDRSSVGNALYVVLNMAAGGAGGSGMSLTGKKNYADMDQIAGIAPSSKSRQQQPQPQVQQQQQQQPQIPQQQLQQPQQQQQQFSQSQLGYGAGANASLPTLQNQQSYPQNPNNMQQYHSNLATQQTLQLLQQQQNAAAQQQAAALQQQQQYQAQAQLQYQQLLQQQAMQHQAYAQQQQPGMGPGMGGAGMGGVGAMGIGGVANGGGYGVQGGMGMGQGGMQGGMGQGQFGAYGGQQGSGWQYQ
ncbi:hypothetical protein HDV00_011518 [Rhizophlyctis rosea]|nr:hypothetical protein HDV00_011518 [Rhizophlyctis rosea]